MNRLLMLVPLMLLMAGCAPSYMIQKDARLDVAAVMPNPGKAALVVARTTSFGGAINFFTHLERKLIGVTRGKGCLVKTDVEPGTHYLITRTESLETGKIDFEPGKVYYVQQTPRMGWVVARVSLEPVSPEHLAAEVPDDGCDWYELDPANRGDDLSEHEYAEAVTDYEREVKEGHHKEFTDYKGFPPKGK